MDQWIKLRQQIHNDEVPLRQLERDTGIHRQTLRKIRDNSQPPGYQRTRPILKSKMAPYVDRIKAIIKADKDVPNLSVQEQDKGSEVLHLSVVLKC